MPMSDVTTTLNAAYSRIAQEIEQKLIQRANLGRRALRTTVSPSSAKYPVCRILTDAGYTVHLLKSNEIIIETEMSPADKEYKSNVTKARRARPSNYFSQVRTNSDEPSAQ